MKLETLVWAHMYDDTVRFAGDAPATLSAASLTSPKIEPEVVFRIARPSAIEPGVAATAPAPADVLAHVEWLAMGFEIIDCVYPDWKFQPADFVAAYGLHAALVVGRPLEVEAGAIPELVDQLSRFTVRLSRDGEVVAEGPAGTRCSPAPASRSCRRPSRAGRECRPRRGRPRQLGNVDGLAADCRRSNLAGRRRRHRSATLDRDPRLNHTG